MLALVVVVTIILRAGIARPPIYPADTGRPAGTKTTAAATTAAVAPPTLVRPKAVRQPPQHTPVVTVHRPLQTHSRHHPKKGATQAFRSPRATAARPRHYLRDTGVHAPYRHPHPHPHLPSQHPHHPKKGATQAFRSPRPNRPSLPAAHTVARCGTDFGTGEAITSRWTSTSCTLRITVPTRRS